jgi:hypothetical protein
MNPHQDPPALGWVVIAILFGAFLTVLNACGITLFEHAYPDEHPAAPLLLGTLVLPLIFLGFAARHRCRATFKEAATPGLEQAALGARWLALQAEAERILSRVGETSWQTGVQACEPVGRRFHHAWVEGYLRPQPQGDGFQAACPMTPRGNGYWFTEPREGWLSSDE